MRPPIKPEEWYTGEPDQYTWAERYWRKLAADAAALGAPIHHGEMLSHIPALAIAQLHRLTGHPEGRAFLNRMRKAWNSQNKNTTGNKRTFSYSMNATADATLVQIAKWTKRSKSAVLEDLIQRGYNFEEQERAIRRQERAEEAQARRNTKQASAPSKAGTDVTDAVRLRLSKELEARKALSSNLLFLCAQREALLEAMPAANKVLSEGQELRAKEKHLALEAYYEARIQASIAFDGAVEALPSSAGLALDELPVAESNSIMTGVAELAPTVSPPDNHIPPPGCGLNTSPGKGTTTLKRKGPKTGFMEVQVKKTRTYAKVENKDSQPPHDPDRP